MMVLVWQAMLQSEPTFINTKGRVIGTVTTLTICQYQRWRGKWRPRTDCWGSAKPKVH